jgi:hypothetical protein
VTKPCSDSSYWLEGGGGGGGGCEMYTVPKQQAKKELILHLQRYGKSTQRICNNIHRNILYLDINIIYCNLT